MKFKATGCVFILSMLLIITSCSNADIKILHNENIIKEIASINTELYSYSVAIPISTNKKIENLSLVELQGSVDSIIEAEIDFNKDAYKKHNSNYIYIFTLKIKYNTNEQLEINKLNLMLNNEEVVYNIGSIVITDYFASKKNYDDIIYLGSPITAYEYGTFTWEVEVKSKIKIKKIYLTSPDVEISGLQINDNTISDNMQINKTYNNETLYIYVDINLLNQEFQDSIIGCDLVIEYIDLENNVEHISMPPAIFRIYACGKDYTKLYD